MIVTVTPNAAIDRTLRIARLAAGAVHRIEVEHAQAGGKGVNVARILRALGVPVHAIVTVGGEAGAWLARDLRDAGVEVSALEARGESRSCIEILETGGSQRRVTQLHGRGIEADRDLADRLAGCLEDILPRASWVALCGSLPAGLPVDTFARLVELAHQGRTRVALDSSGLALREAWKRNPEIVRVNRDEAAAALDCAPESLASPPYPELGAPKLTVVSDGPR